MRKFFLTIFSCWIFSVLAAQPADSTCLPLRTFTANDLSFKSGERLTLIAAYHWGLVDADVGEAIMTVEEESFRDTHYFYARAYAKTYRFWDNFFEVRDVYEARFFTHDLRPIYFYRDIREGGYRIRNTFFFNSDYSINMSVQKYDRPPRDTIMQGHSCTYDFISLFFNARNMDFSSLSQGKTYPYSFVIDREKYNLWFHYVGKEEKKIDKIGTFRCLKFIVKLIAGEVFDGKNNLYIWISDDDNHIPLYIETPVIVGRVSARLGRYENLKYPLTSKIK
ncbi:MAG: DUF3108 domain-containing protein [Prevotellaceae bacterium]|jgi:hypothetical protein|nr:DUF3108 domain-containing protein [Prevotellaceae bacterium]